MKTVEYFSRRIKRVWHTSQVFAVFALRTLGIVMLRTCNVNFSFFEQKNLDDK